MYVLELFFLLLHHLIHNLPSVVLEWRGQHLCFYAKHAHLKSGRSRTKRKSRLEADDFIIKKLFLKIVEVISLWTIDYSSVMSSKLLPWAMVLQLFHKHHRWTVWFLNGTLEKEDLCANICWILRFFISLYDTQINFLRLKFDLFSFFANKSN